ncbi:MAG: hypothetical protein KKH88_03260 [Nanoarchaeota archaeon]|nr:hypothetical protein [Nanoarchaeota archaeon]MBU1445480.1 hypothetical protein [Nanoarchaeota archaeon]MBU2420646.1 hypothetical protein [Nanoarchaeota archaeon]MBU2475383.1 hypothetical protein [Nanoarchaeota archaeon]MBU3940915.1 hypothetical protein [Nanoarchaeota archaeon]
MKNKRGQGISMNMIIIIILAILVLLVISIIFLGGAGTLNQRLRNIFGGSAGAYDMDLAKANCQNYCDVAKTVPNVKTSAYCTHIFRGVDSDGDGQSNGDYVCDGNNNVAPAPTMPAGSRGPAGYGNLNVICLGVICKP